MKNISKKIVCIAVLAFLTSCQTITKNSIIAPIEEDDYQEIIDSQSPRSQKYQGFYNTIDIQATLLKPKIRQALSQKKAEVYLWNTEIYEQEKVLTEKSLSSETQVFVAFYSPDRRVIDFTKKASVWKIFLDVNGKRYDGVIAKNKVPFVELKALYPYLTPFQSVYTITFAVPMISIADMPARLILSGPFESTELAFSANP